MKIEHVSVFFVFIVVFFLGLYCPKYLFAATQSLSANNVPLTIDQLQEFDIGISFSCPGCTSDSYLRAVFYPSGTSYFGYTMDNNGNWSNAAGGSCTTYYKIVQADLSKEGTWSGKLKVKPDKDSPYYNGPGEYLFKVGRYTPSCSSPSVWSAETTIAITGPTSTPTSTPTNPPTATSTPASTSTPTKTPTPTPKPTGSMNGIQESATTSSQALLGESSASAENEVVISSPTPVTKVLSSHLSKIPLLLIIGSVLIFIICGILLYLKFRGKIPFFTAGNDI